MVIKEFFSKSAGLSKIGFTNAIDTATIAIFWLYLATILSTESYGEISYFIAIAALTSVISLLGSGNTLMVYIAKGIKLESTIYFTVIIISLVTSVIVFGILQNIAISLFIIGQVIFSLITFEMLGRKEYDNYSKYIISQRIISVILAIILYYIIGINGIIFGFAFSFLPYYFRLYNVFKHSKIEIKYLKKYFVFMFNSYSFDLSKVFPSYADKLLIYPLLGFALLGNYQLGIQSLMVLTIIPYTVFQFILPRESSGINNRKLQIITVLISILLSILVLFLTPIVFPIIFPQFVYAIEIVQIMSLAIIPISISFMYIPNFLVGGKSKFVLIGSAIFVFLQIILIILLAKNNGINGVAMAFIVGATAEAIFFMIIKKFVIKNN
jgi:O-antigen/teichoic acid export membrane protein